MKTKFLFFLIVISISEVIFSQNNLSIVENQSGVFIFSQCRPKSKYTIIGEVFYSGEAKLKNLSIYNPVLHSSSNYVYTDSPQYNEIKNTLVAQSVMANREVQGIIIDGKHATMVKFTDNDISNDTAIVDKIQGKYVFVNCKPVSNYEYVKTKYCTIVSDNSLKSIISSLLKKCKNLEHDGIIVTTVTGGKDIAEAIKFL